MFAWLAADHTADPGSVHKLTTSCEHFHRIPPHAAAGSRHYLMVTLGSWVTPQVITALVPLMTLWSCGGFVMRVRAANTHRSGCYTEAVFEQRIWRELTGLGLIFQSMSLRNSVNHMLFLLRGVFARTATVNPCAEKWARAWVIRLIVRESRQWPPGARYLVHLQVNKSRIKDIQIFPFIFFSKGLAHTLQYFMLVKRGKWKHRQIIQAAWVMCRGSPVSVILTPDN